MNIIFVALHEAAGLVRGISFDRVFAQKMERKKTEPKMILISKMYKYVLIQKDLMFCSKFKFPFIFIVFQMIIFK